MTRFILKFSRKIFSVVFMLPLMAIAADQGGESVLPKVTAMPPSEWRMNMGFLAGISNPEGRYASSPTYGIDIGLQPYLHYSLGAEFNTSRMEPRGATKIQRTSYLLRGAYHFRGNNPFLRHAYAGANIGPVLDANNTAEWGFGPVVGFDIPLNQAAHGYFTLGLTARYLFTASSSPDMTVANAVLKYWY